MSTEIPPTSPRPRQNAWSLVLLFVLLGLILIAAAYFRFTGLDWGEFQYLHPDERFLVWVGADISPVNSLSEYFNTAASTLNPVNVGHSFYVYGTLPMFITRYIVQWTYGHSGFNEMTTIGRELSALVDILTVLFVFLAGCRLYGKRAGLLGAAFSALMVLQIQQSHFFTMDTFITFFTFLAVFFAILVMTVPWEKGFLNSNQVSVDGVDRETNRETKPRKGFVSRFVSSPLFWLSIAFGISLGSAVASKINAAPVAALLPLAALIRILEMPRRERERIILIALPYMALGAFVSLLTFRIAQPYAFAGPGFFGLRLDPTWLDNMRQAQAGSYGDVDYPFALQWARRGVTFSGENMVLWGLGLPLGILAWAGFLWAGWRMLRGEWQKHLLLWAWCGGYFAWQSTLFNPTMRYQLPIYPVLAVFAGWAVVALWDWGKTSNQLRWVQRSVPLITAGSDQSLRSGKGVIWARVAAVIVGAGVLGLTAGWAYAFTRIYVEPITRIAASRWIYQNIPGAVDVHIQTGQGQVNQPVYYPGGVNVLPGSPYKTEFIPQASGSLNSVQFGSLTDQSNLQQPATLHVTISADPDGKEILATGEVDAELVDKHDATVDLDQAALVKFQQIYYLTVEVTTPLHNIALDGPITLQIQSGADQINQALTYPEQPVMENRGQVVTFMASQDGTINEIYLANLVDGQATAGEKTLTVDLSSGGGDVLASGTVSGAFASSSQDSGQSYLVKLNQPVKVGKGELFTIRLNMQGSGALTLNGAGIVNESDFDDALPLRLDGYDAIYPRGLNMQMYWDDNPEKVDRFLNMMQQSEYIVMTSNRQWGSIPRVPERYPMSSIYYRNLLGCPAGKDVVWCYQVAQVGTFHGSLGYDLVQVFESDPSIGGIHINDQFAEEAFTVYDHPKVMIFKKNSTFNPEYVRQMLSAVNFADIIRVTPKKASGHPANLMLPDARWQQDEQSGSWSELFDPNALQNRFEVFGVALWYLALALLGLLVYPLVRLAMPGLPDKGYPLSRMVGLLLLAYMFWMSGSFQISTSRWMITAAVALIAAVGLFLAYWQRDGLRDELRTRKRYFLVIEGLFLVFFLFDLFIRYGNPDLWHPNFGGEKPMDFSYFNAVLKSASFPPYDPWFAGGYLNYYYYGFVLVGVLVKWLGIVPSFAYNLILPTVFMLMAMGAFSGGWNLVAAFREWRAKVISNQLPAASDQATGDGEQLPMTGEQAGEVKVQEAQEGEGGEAVGAKQPLASKQAQERENASGWLPYAAGAAAALMMAVFGNLGTVQMIFRGYARLAAPGGTIDNVGLILRWVYAIRGAVMSLSGTHLPYYLGDWYWIPSRVMPPPDNAITEFPFFTTLYADPHAHLFAMPVALLALAWALSVVLCRARWKGILGVTACFLLGGLAIGALYPINLSDIYTYLPLGAAAVGYSLWRYFDVSRLCRFSILPDLAKRVLVAAAGVLVLAALAFLMYRPYAWWYGQAYSSIDVWHSVRTPVSSYLVHWGLFLFVMVSWMAWETIDWMAKTPLSSLNKLRPYRSLIWGAVVALLGVIILLQVYVMRQPQHDQDWKGVTIAWIVLPLAAWAGVLLLRPGLPDTKRIVLFLIGTGLLITLMVDFVVVRGDIGRMNTVFKFYLQVWTLFAVASGAMLIWLIDGLAQWRPTLRRLWQVALVALVASAAMFTLMGTMAKVKDRMNANAPRTLDGMTYMAYSTYNEQGKDMDLSQDDRGIQWMQEHVPGSPVIVEANSGNLYRWFSRYTIYTGLPGVLGWQWHQQQQRALLPGDWVTQRLDEINSFYLTTDPDEARSFLRKYNVQYIIYGQLERIEYPGAGLAKFKQYEGVLWDKVYEDKDTIIYKVIQP